MAYFSMQTSAWILTVISIDRYLIVTNNIWKQKYSRNIKFSLIIIFAITCLIGLLNLPVVFLNGKQSSNRFSSINTSYILKNKFSNQILNSTTRMNRKVECYTTNFIIFWQKFSLILECLIPLFLMITFNFLLIKRTYKSSTRLANAPLSQQPQQNYKNAKLKARLKKSVSMNGNLSAMENRSLDNSSYLDLTSNEPKKPKTLLKQGDHFSSSMNLSDIPKFTDEKQSKRVFSPLVENYSKLKRKFKSVDNSINKIRGFQAQDQSKIKNCSISNLEFLNSINTINIEPVNHSFLSASNAFSINCPHSQSQRNSSGDTARSMIFISDSYRSSRKYFLNYRNRRIVLMLSLLTLSFTVSTLPSSIFYTFFRPNINKKPYKRLLTMSFNLLRHLSHTFNFLIYFTSSSVIKQQLKEIFNGKIFQQNLSLLCLYKYLKHLFCCYCCCYFKFRFKFKKNNTIGNSTDDDNDAKLESRKCGESVNMCRMRNKCPNENTDNLSCGQRVLSDEFKAKMLILRQSSLLSIDASISNSLNFYADSNLEDIPHEAKIYHFVDNDIEECTINTHESNLNENINGKSEITRQIDNAVPSIKNKKNAAKTNLNVPKLMLNSQAISKKKFKKPSWF